MGRDCSLPFENIEGLHHYIEASTLNGKPAYLEAIGWSAADLQPQRATGSGPLEPVTGPPPPGRRIRADTGACLGLPLQPVRHWSISPCR